MNAPMIFNECAQEGNDLLAGEKLGDTREMTKKKKPVAKGGAKRADTMHKTLEEGRFCEVNMQKKRCKGYLID